MSEIQMPRLSDTMEEGVISTWVKNVGDKVASGDVLVEIETDKAVMEYEAYEDGYLVKQSVSEGETVPIGAVIGVIADSPDAVPEDSGDGGSEPEAAPAEEEQGEKAEEIQEAAEGTEAESAGESAASSGDGAARPRTSPLARRLAKEYGLDINRIQGSGPKGRIVRADIEAAREGGAAEQAAPAAQPKEEAKPAAEKAATAPAFDDGRASEELKVSNVRKVIARRLTESKQTVPHFYLRRTIDAEALKAFRAQINEQLSSTGVKVSFNDLIVKASATALKLHPAVNTSWVDDKLLQHHRVNVGVAVAVDAGLVVPVLHDTDKATLSEISTRTRELAGKARDGKLKPQEMSGGTFSVSNLGMFGVDSFSAVINPPEAAILAVGAMRQEPVVVDGEVVVRNRISLELSVDHRAVDGAVGAAFLKDLAEILEEPMRIIL
ncbi:MULTISPECIES: dihydrolipoamide acetyltransferase family protein [Nocardiopsis]|uniref:Dihydrolipoamide acetyltransferase component of pyruvate dehydrogenase complex n=1 Tax=Nocardiopsis dassonvillei (strain ATCC 23218 / DSM 43111 / CIP 107115 / JCM 7437 / KCTC 9190 / NBRC 14626 / NCTC 10488 / NRRL B-5397 / IMRU 509) TaxID=446468 RepID=D7B0A2_NOCDD|nr:MULTISPECIES: dihydrolipoamide acetyltransferase family protein [Nocardiopsis]ADH70190.1 catalytic domain of components of various dehydrogenase complexes [Nocardiopsis dassonvillei subsp. dassonvillei DSM 43111]APC38158.1 dihydrolipoamide acetyltransferase [Nocardiopsis dassonvillei]NKY80252.1 2-oxo acid dehydrogenase subunit E2 [Nocardiopsis dassonvillei]VEI90708.1 Dihydrolipoyllysine-residue acetyltransferase component of pyruvate dehydrogenase complex [Nocardiopsis dassonvillei]